MSSKSVSDISQPEFSKLRMALWPIHNYEMKKFLPMGLMMFFILFIYTIARDAKDAIINTAAGAGPEVLPFLKSWAVLPSALIFVLVYTKLANVVSREKLFYIIILPFIIFFGLFAYVIYPNRELLHPSLETIQALKAAYPRIQHFFPIWGVWSYSLFYVLSELWGSVMISLLFWQFANEITRTNEAKRFYAMFGLLSNAALILSGGTIYYFSKIQASLPPEVDAWGVSLNYMMTAVVIAGLLIMAIYRWMNVNVLTDPKYYDAAIQTGTKKEKKPKLSIKESFAYLLRSKYLGYIAVLVLCYGISINIVEQVWKKMMQLQFPLPNDYSAAMGVYSMTTGLVTMLLIMMTKGIVRKFGWFMGAIITPLIVLITGVLFFTFVFFKEALGPMVIFGIALTPVFLAVIIGGIQGIVSKGTKYSLFDPTKEMAYIPLDQELKVKGKAAVDVIGGRLGKASGGYVSQILYGVLAASSVLQIAPYLFVVFIVITLIWMGAVKGLSSMYNALVSEQEAMPKKTA